MTTESISNLVPSTNRGRYAQDDPVSGPDVISWQPLAVLLGGHWIKGKVEHAGNLYESRRGGQAERGYYFIAADDSTVCGLCAGMQVRRC